MVGAAAVYRPAGPVNVPIEFFVAQGLAEPLRIDTSGLRHLDSAHLSHYAVPLTGEINSSPLRVGEMIRPGKCLSTCAPTLAGLSI